jgi:hypothetical protein
MSEGFHAGANDSLNARALAEARTIEAGLSSKRHIDAPRWPGVGTLVRVAGVAILAVIVVGWVLTLFNAG